MDPDLEGADVSENPITNKKQISPPPRIRVLLLSTWLVITLFIFVTGTFAIAQIWPYNNASVTQISGISHTEETSDGIPVIYEDQPIQYLVDLCNYGVDIYATRWIDSYGPVLPETENLEVSRDNLSTSELIKQSIFYAPIVDGCITDLGVVLEIPETVQTGIYYKLRTDNTYSPNFMTSVTNTTETDLFYLARRGVPIP